MYNISNLFTVLSQSNADQQLPSVIFIERGKSTDEHPDNNIQNGATVVKSVLDALMASTAWKDSIFILAYDEGGGLYDHVPPFLVAPPDDITPQCKAGLTPGLFNLSGFRVPMIAISPYSKPHYVSHTSMETTSILKLIETRFNLPPLTQRRCQCTGYDGVLRLHKSVLAHAAAAAGTTERMFDHTLALQPAVGAVSQFLIDARSQKIRGAPGERL